MGYVLFALVVVVLAVVLQPKMPQVKPPELSELDLPTVKQGKPIPKVFGRRIVTSPSVVWYGDLAYNNVRGKKSRPGGSRVILGQRYFMGLHMAICQGPVDEITQIYVGKRSLEVTAASANTSRSVDKRDLFGGDKKEGGVVATIDYEFGLDTQTANSYLTTQFGAETPSFRGATCLVVREHVSTEKKYRSSGGGAFVASMSPYPKPWALDVLDIPGGTFNISRQVVNGVANGGHIIYDSLTNTDWGIGVPSADIDSASFTSVTDQLLDEDFGLSIIYAQQSSMQDFINQVLNHINGILYTDRTTGKFVLKLVRSQCVSTQIPIFDELNVISLVSFERPSYAEMVNEVTLVYRLRGEFEDTSVTVQDLASVQLQGAVVSQTVQYPGIDDKDLAGRVALRDLNSLSTPLARVKLVLNREAWSLNPGDTFVFSWAAYGVVQMVLRVLAVNYGTFESGVVMVETIEDIFNMPNNSYIDPVESGWEEEVGPAEVSPATRAVELPYFVVQTIFEQSDIDALLADTAMVQTVAQVPPVATISYQLWTRLSGGTYEEVIDGEFSPTALITNALDRVTKLTIPYNSPSGGLGQITLGSYAYIDDEVLRVDAIDTGALTVDLGRGFLDSVPTEHSAGAIIFFAQDSNAIDTTAYTVTDVVNAKVLPQTSVDTLDIASAVELTVTTVGRRVKPYPPAQVKIEAVYFPTSVIDATVNVTWTHQDRTEQLVELSGTDWFETSVGSQETGVLYDVRYYDDDTATLLNTDAGVSGTSSSFAPSVLEGASFNMRIEVDAIRDATDVNFVTFSHTFLYTNPADITGTGALVAQDSAVAGTNATGDNRTLENGDNRTTE